MKKKSFLIATVAVIVLTLLFNACSKFPDNTGDDLVTKGKNSAFLQLLIMTVILPLFYQRMK